MKQSHPAPLLKASPMDGNALSAVHQRMFFLKKTDLNDRQPSGYETLQVKTQATHGGLNIATHHYIMGTLVYLGTCNIFLLLLITQHPSLSINSSTEILSLSPQEVQDYTTWPPLWRSFGLTLTQSLIILVIPENHFKTINKTIISSWFYQK